jgi:ribosomal protein S18 acetylase RimI-like enzyme
MTTAPIATTAPITTATVADAERAIATLTLAFSSDPPNRWVWPDPQQYLEAFPAFIAAFGGAAFEQGTAYRIDGYAGAALWLPPEAHPDEEALASLIQRTVAEHDQADLFAILEQLGGAHPNEPHWYLPLIGVDPGQQGKGYGSTLLRQGLAACDRDGTPAYLESTSPQSVRLYERHGFEVVGTIRLGTCPPIFPMVRTAR